MVGALPRLQVAAGALPRLQVVAAEALPRLQVVGALPRLQVVVGALPQLQVVGQPVQQADQHHNSRRSAHQGALQPHTTSRVPH